MSFGSAMRFEVKDGGKGGIFWKQEKPKQKTRKFGYKSKDLRHAIRKTEPEYEEEPKEKVKPAKDFIKKNRNQYVKPRPDDDKENYRINTASSGRTTTSIKPGTVTLTQDQLNALLTTVGKLKPGEASNLRISIDADNNTLKVDSPREQLDTAPNSSRSDDGDQNPAADGEFSIFDLTKNNSRGGPQGNRDSSGYASEEKSTSSKEVRFNTARNEERQRTPDAVPVPPPLVPWRHMTVAERKRLQWAREKAAEEELQKQKNYDPWGRPGAGAPQKQLEPEVQQESRGKTPEEDKLRKKIDDIEAKYSDFLKPIEKDADSSRPPTESQESQIKKGSDETESGIIPGLDSSYVMESGPMKEKKSKASKQLDDKGNTRPPKRPDRKEKPWKNKENREIKTDQRGQETDDRRERQRGPGTRQDEERGRQRKEEGSRKERNRDDEREEERVVRQETEPKATHPEGLSAAPAAMQTSLFIGNSEPDNTHFLTKKEQEKRKWLEELDRQREEKRLQKQREKEKQREGLDDTWANRFVSPSTQPALQSNAQQQQYQSPAYPSRGAWDRPEGHPPRNNEAEQSGMPPAAMRSAMNIGDVAPNLDRIEMRQAEEKRLWLAELDKQREEQREARMRLKEKQRASEETWASRFTQDPRSVPAAPVSNEPAANSHNDNSTRISSAPQPVVTESLDDEDKTFLRGQNVHMDPITKRELEEKRRKHLEYQAAIKAQIEEKENQKRAERERKWKEEMEEERKLKAERDALQRQLEAEDSKNRQKEEARQRQVEQLKTIMDAEQERAQEQRMMKRLTTLKQAGHDISGLKAHYEEPGTVVARDSTSRQMSANYGTRAISPRRNQINVDPSSVPGLMPSPRENYGANISPQLNPAATYRATEGPGSLHNSQDFSSQPISHDPYTENRVLTPSRFRQPSQGYSLPSSTLREFATQTDQLLELRKESSEVEIEYRAPPSDNRPGKAVRAKSAEKKKATGGVKAKPPPSKLTGQKKPYPIKGKTAAWNYQNLKQKAPVKQSEKDLFYDQKRQESEERRAKRERQLQYLVELNKQVIPTEREPRSNHPTSQQLANTDSDFVDGEDVQRDGNRPGHGRGPVVNGDSSHRSRSPPVNRTGKYRPSNRSPPVPAVKRKTGQNQARDHDSDYHADTPHRNRPDPGFSPVIDERGNVKVPTKDTDFIPFTRTTDILDPSRAEEPMQLSREHTRIQQARQHYHENLRPADFGNHLDMYEDKQRQPAPKNHKDPILNPGLVKDHPTARQDQILQQLSSLKQTLMQRQRELENCMSPKELEK